jgi:hypothetical protein
MAFCPNCGTPNTDQTEKCVACGFELIVPKQKAKFKGTIMMSGIKAPTSPEQAPGATTLNNGSSAPSTSNASGPEPAPRSQPAPSLPPGPVSPGGRNLSHQKTMMGHASALLPTQPMPPAATASPSTPSGPDAVTRETPRASFAGSAAAPYDGSSTGARDVLRESGSQGPARPSSSDPMAASSSSSSGSAPASAWHGSAASGSVSTAGRTFAQGGVGYESTLPPPAPDKPNPGKVLAIGCAVALALLVLAGLLSYYVLRPKLQAMFSGDDGSAEAAAWQASISQSLAQVTGLCQVDCAQAGVFFHPLTQASLLGEARALTPERLQKLGDPTLSQATMLAGTGDEELATKLGLDPQQCARVTAGGAKVVSCSVPDVEGKPSVLRIVHLSGISSL